MNEHHICPWNEANKICDIDYQTWQKHATTTDFTGRTYFEFDGVGTTPMGMDVH